MRVFRRLESYSTITDSLFPGHFILAVLVEESLASSCLNKYGINLSNGASGELGDEVAESYNALVSVEESSDSTIESNDCTATRLRLVKIGAGWAASILQRAQSVARHQGDGDVSTEHLIQGMVEASTPVQSLLLQLGLDNESVGRQLEITTEPAPVLPVDVEFELQIEEDVPAIQQTQIESTQHSRIAAVIDANLNRCREGLRVLDDYARFVLRSSELTASLKQLRHRVVTAEKVLLAAVPDLLSFRDTEADAGTSVSTAGEMLRTGIEDLAAANARRVQESLRSLEEFGKLLSADFSAEVKQIRYESYTLHQRLCVSEQKPQLELLDLSDTAGSVRSRETRVARLAAAKLYVLLTESLCGKPWKTVVTEVLAAGADVIQLREKDLGANEVVSRGRWIAAACRESGALFVMNDHPDIAVRADADGVHVGQDDVSPHAARQIVGESRLVGLSTHSRQQIQSACESPDVDYLGVGPVFLSTTKSFQDFPGLNLVGEAAEIASLPWFAIGGMQPSNLPQAISAGAVRVAVCGAIIGSASPSEATASVRELLDDGSPDLLKFNRG